MYRKKYIYERELWPDLEWDWAALSDAVARVYLLRGSLHGKLDALGFSVRNELLLNSVSDEVLKSSEIEGEKLDMAGVRSSVARRLGIDSAGIGDVYPDHYTEGVVEMVIDAVQDYKLRLTDERLFGWHAALFPVGYSGSRHIIVGAYRKSDMEIVSGPFGKEQVHFTAPKPERVEPEMKAFLKWIEGEQGIDPVIKAGLAHLRFVTIHPFDDGNGRIGRAIADMMLARAEGDANRYYSLSSRMSAEKNEY
jgi:Fic family protein